MGDARALAVVAERTPPGGGSIMSSHSCHRIMGRHPPRPALSKSAVSSVGRAQPTRRRYPPYAPLHISRGPAASFTESPAALLEAKALIASQLESHPSDASWLQAKAQADLLDGKYDAAVEALHHALELEPNSPALLIDLATAYSQRAQAEDKMDDFAAAYEHLSHALKLRPDDPIALFNRAIVAEHLYLYQQALDDSEHYLRIDPNSPWAEEAGNRAYATG